MEYIIIDPTTTTARPGGHEGKKGFTAVRKIMGKEVMRQDDRKCILYSQFDLGNKYKVYYNNGGRWVLYNSFATIGEANAYYDKML